MHRDTIIETLIAEIKMTEIKYHHYFFSSKMLIFLFITYSSNYDFLCTILIIFYFIMEFFIYK